MSKERIDKTRGYLLCKILPFYEDLFSTSKRGEGSFFLNAYDKTFRQFDPARPPGYCEPHISKTMRVIILKQKLKDAHFSKLRLFKFLKQSTKLSEHEIYPSR